MLDAAAVGRRLARLATNVVVRAPALWPLFKMPLRRQFDWLAPSWDARVGREGRRAFEAALDRVTISPRRALDLGTGTGFGAVAVARRWPAATIVGVDLAEAMLAEARRALPAELAPRVRFERGDAARLPYPSETFDLVTLANMIPFFDELARVTAPGGFVVLGFTSGAQTPIYVPADRLRRELARREFVEFAEVSAGAGTALLARKASRD